METNFRDYTKEQLIGKLILHEHSTTGTSRNRISKIVKVGKASFHIEGDENSFSLINGGQKGLSGTTNYGVHSQCSLITQEEANQLRGTWMINRENREMREKIAKSFDGLSHQQLKRMVEIINTDGK